MLRSSVLSPVIDSSAALFAGNGSHNSNSNSSSSSSSSNDDDNLAPPFRYLCDRITTRRLGPDSTRVYHQAIRALQIAANASRISLENNNDNNTNTSVDVNNGEEEREEEEREEREVDEEKKSHKSTLNPTGVIAWPILISPEYIDLLMHGRPEALVVLAWYGALLHHFSELWVFGDGGRFLVESVGGYLGAEWEGWLEWPRGGII